VERFKRERITIDDELSGRPSTPQTDDQCVEVNALIKGNRRITAREIALTVGISYRSTFAIEHHDLSYHKVCARWVPRQSSEDTNGPFYRYVSVSRRDTVMKERTYFNELSQVKKHGSIVTNHALNDSVY
jgi:hypothetical protein